MRTRDREGLGQAEFESVRVFTEQSSPERSVFVETQSFVNCPPLTGHNMPVREGRGGLWCYRFVVIDNGFRNLAGSRIYALSWSQQRF